MEKVYIVMLLILLGLILYWQQNLICELKQMAMKRYANRTNKIQGSNKTKKKNPNKCREKHIALLSAMKSGDPKKATLSNSRQCTDEDGCVTPTKSGQCTSEGRCVTFSTSDAISIDSPDDASIN